jgi:3-oxoacyl-[acyl-carrier protein] reductase
VTGSGRGIGRETAILLAEKGLNVIGYSRTQAEIENVVNEINSIGKGKAIGRECDVSVATEVNDLVKESVKLYGSIDILINNAGISYVKSNRYVGRGMGPNT